MRIFQKTRILLRKHAHSNIFKILQPKQENFQIKYSDIFHIPAQNRLWRGGSNEYSQSMFLLLLSKNKTKQNDIQLYMKKSEEIKHTK